MRLATRIAAFEWLLVGLLVAVSALSIKLVGDLSETAARVSRKDSATMEVVRGLETALYAHELATARVALQQGSPQLIYAARTQFNRAVEAGTDRGLTPAQLEPIERITDRYFIGEESLRAAVASVDRLHGQLAAELAAHADAEIEAGEAGVHLLATAGALALLLAILLATRSDRRITRPLDVLHRTLVALTDPKNADRRVPDGDYDPTLRELGKAINLLADRLAQAERAPDLDRGLMIATAERVIERLPDPVAVVDLAGCLRLTNTPARALLDRHSPNELGIPEAVQAALTGAQDQRWERLISGRGTPVGFIVRLRAPETV